ncbi:hypothetical protein GCM10023262_04920 [Bartonella pachyuromydis]|uniref:Uncharacterized protein n=1 Tax=Bartonella pachyuromydis TaxID=931097 RepID=A0ABP8VEX7_9HYPH
MSDLIRIIVELLFSIGALFIFFYTLFLHYRYKGYSKKEIIKNFVKNILVHYIIFYDIFYLYTLFI